MISIINYISESMNGSIFTLSDLQLELQKYYPVKSYFKFFKLENPKEYKKLFNMKKAIDDYCLIQYQNLENSFYSDNIITSYYALANIDFSKISGKNLIILDSLDVYIDIQNNNFTKKINDLNSFDKIYLLFNTFNIDLLPSKLNNVTVIEYFSKLSSTRINTLQENRDERLMVRTESLHKKYPSSFLYNNRFEFLNTLKFKGFIFSRMQHTNEKITIENIGKLFFEYLYMGKKVDYYPDNILMKDGMCYYMEKIGVDPVREHINIKVPKEMLEKEIFFNKDDLLLDLLGKI